MWFRTAIEFLSVAWKWVVLAVAVLLLMFTVRSCNKASRAEAELARVQEAVELERTGFLVAKREKQTELKAAVAKIPALQAEIDRLGKELGRKPKIVTVERIVTKPAPSEGIPRPKPLPGEPCPECMFAAGDTGQIRVDSAHLETAKGNEVVALSAECWRLTPGPATRILAGVASAPLSRVSVLTPPPKPGWGGGLLGGIGTSGVVGTGLLMTPPIVWRFGLAGAVTAGPGLAAAQVGVVYRP